jgi:tetratricopeptide (TPR) repeat protein
MKKRTIFMAVLALAASGHLAGQINVPNYWGIDAQLAFSGWLFLGQPSSITTDYDTAIACYTMAIKNAPNEKVYYINRGWAYNQKGDYDKAIADCTQAIRLDPNYANPYRHRGFAYYQKGDYAKARSDVTQALRLRPDYKDALELSDLIKKKGY